MMTSSLLRLLFFWLNQAQRTYNFIFVSLVNSANLYLSLLVLNFLLATCVASRSLLKILRGGYLTHSVLLTISDSNLLWQLPVVLVLTFPLGRLSRRFNTVFFGSRIGVNHMVSHWLWLNQLQWMQLRLQAIWWRLVFSVFSEWVNMHSRKY